MFTGIIEALGRVTVMTPDNAGFRLRIRSPLASECAPGDSVAVSGVCLTITAADRDGMQADIGPETARVTTLGTLKEGDPVNLERPLRADGRFGGHFVQGHVDGVGTVTAVRVDGDAHWLRVEFDPSAAGLLVPKGSVAVDGVSLTVAALTATWFEVMLIPFTWGHTTFSHRRPDDRVNLEFDIVGKYVARAAQVANAR